jgi:hypothetical protein
LIALAAASHETFDIFDVLTMANLDYFLLTALAGIIMLALIPRVIRYQTYKGKYRLPPLVPGIPLLGNTFQIPALQQGPWAKKLAEKYGEM